MTILYYKYNIIIIFNVCYVYILNIYAIDFIVFLGEFSNTNWHNIITKLSVPSNVDNNVSGYTKMLPTDIFLHKQLVSDKIVADCIESLIGTYVHVCVINNNIIFCNFFF